MAISKTNTKRFNDTAPAKSVSAYIILNKKRQHVATVRAAYLGKYGSTCLVEVLNFTGDGSLRVQIGRASGYGYDKFTAAIDGAIIDGHEITNHCRKQAPMPKCGYYPSGYKPPKGYSLANGFYVDDKGNKVTRIWLQDDLYGHIDPHGKWIYVLGEYVATYEYRENPKKYKRVSEKRVQWAYSHCYKDSGLDYLRALGYQIIQAV